MTEKQLFDDKRPSKTFSFKFILLKFKYLATIKRT